MKTSQDPRHKMRVGVVQELFAWEFLATNKRRLIRADARIKRGLKFSLRLNYQPNLKITREVLKNLSRIDEEIEKAAPEWPKDRINRVDLAILRLATFELIIKKQAPFKVAVDEAVELAKELGSESSPPFINGALGNIITAYSLDKKNGETD